MSEGARRAFVRQLRHENEKNFGPPARRAVEMTLSSGHPYPWAYVYELTQNARDAGARRISWRSDGGSLLFQHDGNVALDEDHIRGLSSLGASTKGAASVGFMGVGFKSVFGRFRTARISGHGWHLKFHIGTSPGGWDAEIPNWFDALLPRWDTEHFDPDLDYTTAFLLDEPAQPDVSPTDDLAHLASPDDLTPLAVLALRGLRELRVDDVRWGLSVEEGVTAVRRLNDGLARQWRWFRSSYRPDADAMRQFVQIRRDLTHGEAGVEAGVPSEREVIALVPLDDAGLPSPPDRGRVYATLPTQATVPFGCHLQADWLVNLDRQGLREISSDPWQEAIIRQVPKLLQGVLCWLRDASDSVRRKGYKVLCEPQDAEGGVAAALHRLRPEFIRSLEDLEIVPIHGAEPRQFSAPAKVVRLPGRFRVDFGKHPERRPDLLFEHALMDEKLLGDRAVQFAKWLGWGRNVDPDGIRWTETLPGWWSAMESLHTKERVPALFALWACVAEREWHDAPVVPTEAGGWIQAQQTRWLDEPAPSNKESSGAVIATALAPFLPTPGQRLPPSLRANFRRSAYDPGITWFEVRRQDERLEDIVRDATTQVAHDKDFPLVELLDWAIGRGNRVGFVPLVLTEDGPRVPSASLLADPLVPSGWARRLLFPNLPALVDDYEIIEKPSAVVHFLETLGVRGNADLVEVEEDLVYSKSEVAAHLYLELNEVERANRSGWTLLDYVFPFSVQRVPPDALQKWLTLEHRLLANLGKRKAASSYHGPKTTHGERCASWVEALEAHAWILCEDGQRRKPGDVRLEVDLDFEDAPVAVIKGDLAKRLLHEGVQFGVNVPRSAVVRRLELRGSGELGDIELAALLEEVREELEAGNVTPDELTNALHSVIVRQVPILERLVQDTGRGSRSDLGGWVVALSSVERELATAISDIGIDVPETTTGSQALAFLTEIWSREPASVDKIRAHLPSAYRYVLDDIDNGTLDLSAWNEAGTGARLYGKGGWHDIDETLVVDDVQSPIIRQMLPDDRVAVTSAHLGDAAEQIRRVAGALGVPLLSEEIELSKGPRLPDPHWMPNLRHLADALSGLEGREPLRTVTCRGELQLHIQGEPHSVHAYLDESQLMVAGDPAVFGPEAAAQLVEHFQLGQRGNVIPWLTTAICFLSNDETYRTHRDVLTTELGLSLPEPSTLEAEPDPATAAATGDGVSSGVRPSGAAPDSPTYRPASRRRKTASPDSQPTVPQSAPRSPRPGADQFGILVSRAADRAGDARGTEQPPQRTNQETSTKPKDDRRARAAVIAYEKARGRNAIEMPARQPGYDIVSYDPDAGLERRIEVKGIQDDFIENASVVLTARQVHDALQHPEDQVEYWLYVVDRTNTEEPDVLPIPWMRHPSRLRYGFRADTWRRYAVESGPVVDE